MDAAKRSEILGGDFDGEHTASLISQLKTPITWSGTTSAERRAEYEAACADLAHDLVALFEDGADGVVSCEIVNGVIVSATT